MSDEYVLDTPVVRASVAGVRETIAAAGSPAEACDASARASPRSWPTRSACPGARRHAFDEHAGEASPFRSGYVNVACPPE